MPSMDKSCLIAGVELLDKIATSIVFEGGVEISVFPTLLLSLALHGTKTDIVDEPSMLHSMV